MGHSPLTRHLHGIRRQCVSQREMETGGGFINRRGSQDAALDPRHEQGAQINLPIFRHAPERFISLRRKRFPVNCRPGRKMPCSGLFQRHGRLRFDILAYRKPKQARGRVKPAPGGGS